MKQIGMSFCMAPGIAFKSYNLKVASASSVSDDRSGNNHDEKPACPGGRLPSSHHCYIFGCVFCFSNAMLS